MGRNRAGAGWSWCLAGVALVLTLGAGPSIATAAGSAHESCAGCHRQVEPARTAAVSSRCVDCHRDLVVTPRRDAARGHVGRQPSEISAGAPDGPVTCMSCHSPHDNGRRHQLLPLGDEVVSPMGTTLDATTKFCLGCHDRLANFHAPGGGYTLHPVGLRLASARRPGRDDPALPLADVAGTDDPRDDVIACTTCHEVHHNSNRFLLRWTAADQPMACTSCHRQFRPADPTRFASTGLGVGFRAAP